MKKYNIPASNVIRHYDVSGKICPGVLGWNNAQVKNPDGSKTNMQNNSNAWKQFKSSLG
jgi:N-acetylmuramoyl-L-alanine amidase CwlA